MLSVFRIPEPYFTPKNNAATHFYKPDDAVFKEDLSGCFTQINYLFQP